jgi:hypothetical protein
MLVGMKFFAVITLPQPVAEGSCQKVGSSVWNDLPDHVIVLHETHLGHLARDYLGYSDADRKHDG